MSKITPLYPHTSTYARDNGELDAYRASQKANHDCKEAIEDAIREHFDGMRLDPSAVTEVVQEFGLERVLYILASTVQLKDWDGRFSTRNRQRLSSVPMIDSEDRRCFYTVESHPAVLDGFISEFFKKYQESM